MFPFWALTFLRLGLMTQNAELETRMADDPMLKALEAEERKLMAELEKTPAFRRLKLAQNMIAEYRNNPEGEGAASAKDPVPEGRKTALTQIVGDLLAKEKTKTAQVEDAAAEYLTQRGRRATSGELLPAVTAKGIHVTGKTPSKTLSSYLSTSKRFDNVPGFGGYGLIEWGGRRTAPSQAPAGASNEIIDGKLPLNS